MDEYLEMAAYLERVAENEMVPRAISFNDAAALLRRAHERERVMNEELIRLGHFNGDLVSRCGHLEEQVQAFNTALAELKCNIPPHYVHGLMRALATLEADNG